MRELGDLEQLFREAAPPIPERDRVGCEVCPGKCGRLDLHLIPTPELLRGFRHHAIQFSRANPDGFPGGPDWDQLERFACIAKRHGEAAEQVFLELLEDEHEGVRYCAAYMAIRVGFANAAPVRVLRSLVDNKSPFARHASMAVWVWEQERAGTMPMSPLSRKHRFEKP